MAKSIIDIFAKPFLVGDDMPLFQRGNLIYENSKHRLIYSKGYYVCSLKQKKKCHNDAEKSLRVKDFERKFAGYIKPLEITQSDVHKIKLEIVGRLLEIESENRIEIDMRIEAMEILIQSLAKKVAKNKGINRNDIGKLKRAFLELVQLNYPNFLGFLVLANIEIFTWSQYPRAKALMMSFLMEKIYITDNGKITKIKLEGLADYLFRYLGRIPNFAKEFTNKFEDLVIDRMPFSNNFSEAIRIFKQSNYRNALSYGTIFHSNYYEKKVINTIFNVLNDIKPNEKIRYLRLINRYYARHPFNALWVQDLTYKKLIEAFEKSAQSSL